MHMLSVDKLSYKKQHKLKESIFFWKNVFIKNILNYIILMDIKYDYLSTNLIFTCN